ncbi:probable ATP-dependent RNA helicase spindle-E [Drosophila sulfurigaster albostrigata]|uniref:probable ATP-dependent RNA helicase spindle-E n=1 Tax=Drosophila sulfurigaster albostrigata TaxID=89887 RepID=UPI002D219A2E|nr:probable ATP-dependent RNA helicase spindle-E [Drosophila sulfurigaster albostrigata]
MDSDIMDFFDFSKEFKRGNALQGCITGDPKILAVETKDSNPIKRKMVGTDYVNEIAEKEKELMKKLDGNKNNFSMRNKTLNDLDSDDDDGEMEEQPRVRSDEAYYEKYHFDLNRDKNLPIYAHCGEIMAAINDNPVVILKGETGCGKTTQVPQYILDEAFKRREFCKIVVTQPRRIAAISIANRVCQERQWQPGTVCGYQVGLHRPANMEDTRLLYCTTGVLLNNLINQKTLTHYTHIILDEVHERDEDMDFLLIVVRRLLALNSRHVKVILMSATIDANEFCKYFASTSWIPPVVTASHGRKYPLVKYYRDQFKNIHCKDEPQQREPGISPDRYGDAIKILLVIDNMERKAVGTSRQTYEESKRTGAVLIFLPGIHEIDTMAEHIKQVMGENPSTEITIVRCHSLLSPEAQAEVFQPPPVGHRKVILTTNISESSITVPDVSYVIDFCLTKVLHTNSASNFKSLRLEWASKVNCRQRAGRVGRLRSGRVYRMVTKDFYLNEMKEFGVPEMLRSPLENSILKAKELDMGSPTEILALAMSPPNLFDIHNTVLLLKEVGALFTTVDGVYEDLDGDITHWGRIMTRLPLDVRLSRLIILGYVFNCLDEAIIMAAGMSVRGLFLTERRGQNEAFWMRYAFSDGSGSDMIAVYRMYKMYLNICQDRMQKDSEHQWARRFCVCLRSLREMHLMVQDLQQRCTSMYLQNMPSSACKSWNDHEKAIVLKVIIAGAFYPNYFMRADKANEDYDSNIYRATNGNDPCRTVYFTKFEPRYMGELYTRRIKELFLEAKIPAKKMDVTFSHGSEKIFVTFKEDDDEYNYMNPIHVPGRVATEVYKAVRMRLNNAYRPLHVIEKTSALKYVEQHGIGVVSDSTWVPPCKKWNVELLPLPSVFDKIVAGKISHIVNCSKFYFQPNELLDRIDSMTELINSPQHLSCHVKNPSIITTGLELLAMHKQHYQRATVIRVETQANGYPKFSVRFIDYGNTALLAIDQLRMMPYELKYKLDQLPPRMLECRLALIQPSSLVSNYNRWDNEAVEMLTTVSKRGTIELEIYSLVNNVAAVLLHMRDGLLNDKLVERQLARRADEDYMSRKDHDFRISKQEVACHESHTEKHHINEDYLRSVQNPTDQNLKPPPLDKCNQTIMLKGPFSPLETSMCSMLRVGLFKTVVIERESVNGVLLDSDPQDRHNQMVVAASVSETDGDKLTARGTTLMPNIHGFSALMTLLFCPTMQIKCNKERTKYVCILAGLGFNPKTMQSHFEEHDMVVNLDVAVLEDDIRIINQMRYNIDMLFFHSDPNQLPTATDEGRATIFNQLQSLLTGVLNKDRSFIERNLSNSDHVWEDMSDLEPAAEPLGKRAILPIHCYYELEIENMSNLLALQANCKQLYEWRNFRRDMSMLQCKLCNVMLESVTQLRLHLLTQLHRDREKQIGWKPL